MSNSLNVIFKTKFAAETLVDKNNKDVMAPVHFHQSGLTTFFTKEQLIKTTQMFVI